MDGPAFTITGALILGALILKGTDLAKYLISGLFGPDEDSKKKAWNGFLTLVLTAAIGVGTVFLFSGTQWADEVKLGDEQFSKLGWGSLVTFGLVASSFGALLYDVKKAIDNTDTAATPRIIKDVERNVEKARKTAREN